VDRVSTFLARPAEPAVFADPTGRRERVVRAALLVLAACFALWLAALVAGAVGFGTLPGVPARPAMVHRVEPVRGIPVDLRDPALPARPRPS